MNDIHNATLGRRDHQARTSPALANLPNIDLQPTARVHDQLHLQRRCLRGVLFPFTLLLRPRNVLDPSCGSSAEQRIELHEAEEGDLLYLSVPDFFLCFFVVFFSAVELRFRTTVSSWTGSFTSFTTRATSNYRSRSTRLAPNRIILLATQRGDVSLCSTRAHVAPRVP